MEMNNKMKEKVQSATEALKNLSKLMKDAHGNVKISKIYYNKENNTTKNNKGFVVLEHRFDRDVLVDINVIGHSFSYKKANEKAEEDIDELIGIYDKFNYTIKKEDVPENEHHIVFSNGQEYHVNVIECDEF